MNTKSFYETRKGMIVMGKVYNKKNDGEFEDEFHKMYTNHDRKYVDVRICDALKEKTQDTSYQRITKQLDDDYYMVIVRVKKNSKKNEVFNELGFGILKDAV